MSRVILRTGAVFAFSVIFAPAATAGGALVGAPAADNLKGSVIIQKPIQNPQIFSIKVKAGGQINLDTLDISFAGQASHIGAFTAVGQLDPTTFAIQGIMTASNGDTINFTGSFQTGPLGEIEATLNFDHGTGSFHGLNGSASGPVALDPDYMFTLDLEGIVSFVELG